MFVCISSDCRTTWLLSVKRWRKKRNLKDIEFLYLSSNLATGERRDVFDHGKGLDREN